MPKNNSAAHHCVSVGNSLLIPCFFSPSPSFAFHLPSLAPSPSESSVLRRKEEEETGRVHFQCESDPTETRAMEESRNQTPKDHLLELLHSCITVEPAVCLPALSLTALVDVKTEMSCEKYAQNPI